MLTDPITAHIAVNHASQPRNKKEGPHFRGVGIVLSDHYAIREIYACPGFGWDDAPIIASAILQCPPCSEMSIHCPLLERRMREIESSQSGKNVYGKRYEAYDEFQHLIELERRGRLLMVQSDENAVMQTMRAKAAARQAKNVAISQAAALSEKYKSQGYFASNLIRLDL